MRFDLHMHTTHSDGELTVKELLEKAKSLDLTGLSITDHDTIGSYPEAFQLGDAMNLKILSGVEISCLQDEASIHVLGYGFSIHDEEFLAFIKKCQKLRKERNLKMIEKLSENNITITQEELKEAFNKPLSQIGRPHFAKLLVKKGVVKTSQDAFNNYLKDGAKCYVLGHRPSVLDAIKALHKAKAFAVVAHPHLINNAQLVKDVLKLPIDGLECYYAKFMPSQEKKWIDIATEKKWVMTGGSDFHGDGKRNNELGCSWVSEDAFNVLYERQKANENAEL